MAKTESNGWQELQEQSTATLLSYLKSEVTGPEDSKKARLASAVLGTCVRHEATESGRQRMIVGLAHGMAHTKAEFAEYVRLAMPQLKLPSPPPDRAEGTG